MYSFALEAPVCDAGAPSLPTNAMATVNQKIFRTANAPNTAPTEAETTVCQALIDLESHIPELKAELRALQVSAVKEVEVKGGKKAYVVFVPMIQLKAFHKIQQRYVSRAAPAYSQAHP